MIQNIYPDFKCICGKVYEIEDDENWVYNKEIDMYICIECANSLVIQLLIKHDGFALHSEDHEQFVNKILNENQKFIDEYKKGNIKIINYLQGKIMKLGKNKLHSQLINKILKNKLEI